MENTKTEMCLAELLFLDGIFMLIFILTLFLAVTCLAPRNLFAIDLPLVFGGVTLPFARTFSKWLTYLRFHENVKVAELLHWEPNAIRWLFVDFGVRGYTWVFRAVSVITAVAAFYHLIGYFI